MKKQLFSLMLSTAIFTTNPLFAMDQLEDNLDEERGTLCILPKETLRNVLWQMPDEDVVGAGSSLACTSKRMNMVFNDSLVWNCVDTKICTPFVHNTYAFLGREANKRPWVKKMIIKNYLSNFTIEENRNNSYEITIGQLVSFHKEPYPDSEHPNSWSFSIGNRSFQLFKYGANVAQDYLETLDQSLVLAFSRAFPEVEGHNPWKTENLFLSLVSLSADDQYSNWAKEMRNPSTRCEYLTFLLNHGKTFFTTKHNVFYIRPIAAQREEPIADQIEPVVVLDPQ